MKITRRKLRQLIKEATKGFFYMPEPTNLIDRLLKDDTIDKRIKELLRSKNDITIRQALMLLPSILSKEQLKRYPEFTSGEEYLNLDLLDRSKDSYHDMFKKGKEKVKKELEIKQFLATAIEKGDHRIKKFMNDIKPIIVKYAKKAQDIKVEEGYNEKGRHVVITSSNKLVLEKLNKEAKADGADYTPFDYISATDDPSSKIRRIYKTGLYPVPLIDPTEEYYERERFYRSRQAKELLRFMNKRSMGTLWNQRRKKIKKG